jgi:hypothetical protein
VAVVGGVGVEEVVGAEVGDAEDKGHTVLVVFLEFGGQGVLELAVE